MEKDVLTMEKFLLAHIEDMNKDFERTEQIAQLRKADKALEERRDEIALALDKLGDERYEICKRLGTRKTELSNLFKQGVADEPQGDLKCFVFVGNRLFKIYIDRKKIYEYAVKELKVVNLSTSKPNV